MPGAVEDCYSGPAGTKDVGVCKGGQATCNKEGTAFGPCTGEVVPRPEDCSTPDDENCDGSPGAPCPTSWSKGFPGSGGALGIALSLDSQGRVLVAGYFGGTIDFGLGPLVAPPMSIAAFVVKLEVNGDIVWANAYGNSGGTGARVNGLAIDAQDDVLIVGDFGGAIHFGPTTLNAKGNDLFVAKLDSGGKALWAKSFGDVGDNDHGNALAVDAQGAAVIAGIFNGSVDFGGGALNGGNFAAFVAKLDAAGNHVWSKACGGAHPAGVAVDVLGNVLVTGYASTDYDFGGNPHAVNGAATVFLAKLADTGLRIWDKNYGGMGAEGQGSSVTTDSGRNIILGGGGLGLDFGGGPVSGNGSPNGFIAKLDPNGQHLWSKGFGNNQAQTLGVAVDSAANVSLTGNFTGTIDLGGGPLMSGGSSFVSRLDSSGNDLWDQAPGPGVGDAIANGAGGAVFVAGQYLGPSVDFGDGSLPAAPAGGVFVAKRPP